MNTIDVESGDYADFRTSDDGIGKMVINSSQSGKL